MAKKDSDNIKDNLKNDAAPARVSDASAGADLIDNALKEAGEKNPRMIYDDTDEDKRPTLAIAGIALSVVLWVILLVLDLHDVTADMIEAAAITVGSIVAGWMCIKGLRRGPIIGRIGLLISGSLTIFALTAFLVLLFVG